MKINISETNNALFAQASGQPAFPLTPSGKNKFRFDQAALILEFNPENQQMILKQGGGIFTFTRIAESKK
jgi:hypothetical protein